MRVRQDLRIGFASPFVGRAAEGTDPAAIQRAAADQGATGRFAPPEEVADLVVFLASERAGNVTGSDFMIDGGLVTTT